ncbi:MAG: TonB-dependent receptor [Bacteroidales bacterium]|jgi:TonB-linked SusC/RagA family outer membrane protein|nr:TonB-dependent receptor [Bacteroidales bacterium]
MNYFLDTIPKYGEVYKLLLIMRFTIVLMIFSTGMLWASSTYSQDTKLSLKMENVTIRQVFDEIERNSEFIFIFRDDAVDVSTKVNLDTTAKSIDEVLQEVFRATNNQYRIVDRQVIVWKNKETDNLSTSAMQTQVVTGIVIDASGEPIPGASVVIKGSTKGVATNFNGRFDITVPHDEDVVLVFSFIGFLAQEVPVKGQNHIEITLLEDSQQIEEVVVVGYGTQKKASVVGSVQSVRPSDLKVPASQLSTAFAGRLSGVVAVQRSGQPGADGASFWIRGISTISDLTSPLIIIDGVQVGTNALNALDPEVIESFSVLKDATATALYGTRGANGVMLVTTKSGANLAKPIINVRFETAMTSPTRTPEIADGVTYMKMYNEAVTSRPSSGIPYSDAKIAGTQAGIDPILYPNVNWYDELFKSSAWNQNLNFNIRGGGAKMDYFLSASVNHETGMLKDRGKNFFSYDNNINMWRYAFQNNLNVHASKTTRVGLRLNAQMRSYHSPATSITDIFANVMKNNAVDCPVLFPNDPRENVLVERDHVAWGGMSSAGMASENPVGNMTKGYADDFQSTVIANLDFEQKLDFVTEGLSFKALASFTNYTRSTVTRNGGYNRYYIDTYDVDNQGIMTGYTLASTSSPSAIVLSTSGSNSGDRRIYIQAMFEYDRTFAGKHNVSGMVLYNQDQTDINNPSNLMNSLPKRKQGIAGRATYSYKYRYLIEANFGYNGSENFAKGHRYGFFPSIAAGYIISEEPFWESLKNTVSNFKIRGSWGKVGNEAVRRQNSSGEWEDVRFAYMSEVSLQSSASYTTGVDQNYSLSGPTYNRFLNEAVTWEVGNKLNLGVDIQLFRSLNITLDAFREIRDGIFMARRTIPNFMGTSGTEIYGNLGKVKNRGFDFSVDYGKNFSKDLYLSAMGTFTYAKNKIMEYDEPDFVQYPGKSRVGHSTNQSLVYIAERLFIDQEEIDNTPTQLLGGNVMAGDIKYRDMPDKEGNSDGRIESNDQIYSGHPTVPQIVYGFGISGKYKNFDASVFFQGVAQTTLMMSDFHPFGTSTTNNVLQFIVDDYWSLDNQNPYAAYPRISKEDIANNSVASTYWQRDASFLKLKNAEIGYTYKFFRVYLSGSNLLTFSKFKLWDPEQGGGAGFKYPTQRVINVGVQVTL